MPQQAANVLGRSLLSINVLSSLACFSVCRCCCCCCCHLSRRQVDAAFDGKLEVLQLLLGA
jgi:hypothetical protein